LEELFNGAKKEVPIKRTRLCKDCKGTGSSKIDEIIFCDKCQGYGVVIGLQQVAPGYVQQVKQYCPDCLGKGKKVKDEYKCKTCIGSTCVMEEKVLGVKIKKGMKHGQQITVENEGDEREGVMAGDIIFILQQLPHPVYQRQDKNLVMIKKIT
jgi:DnaJ homolog subfamily A member 2